MTIGIEERLIENEHRPCTLLLHPRKGLLEVLRTANLCSGSSQSQLRSGVSDDLSLGIESDHENVDIEPCQFGGESGKSFRSAFGESVLNGEVAALLVPAITEPLLKGIDEGGEWRSWIYKHDPDPVDV